MKAGTSHTQFIVDTTTSYDAVCSPNSDGVIIVTLTTVGSSLALYLPNQKQAADFLLLLKNAICEAIEDSEEIAENL